LKQIKKKLIKGKFKVTYTLVSDEQKSKIIDGSELPEAKRKLNGDKRVKYYWKEEID